jgi:hypothetical protein
MKKTLFFFILSTAFLFGQTTANKIDSFSIRADYYAGFDAFGYFYFIHNNIFYKKKDDVVLEYKNIYLGKITKIDFQNPLKIILFYENFNAVVILDNQLAEIQKINFLENRKPLIVTATGIAAQDSIWLYNNNNQIGLYDCLNHSYKIISTPISEGMLYCQSNFNNFYWIDKHAILNSCSIFGKVSALGFVPEFDEIQIISDYLVVYRKNKSIYSYNLNEKRNVLIYSNDEFLHNFYYKENILSIFTAEEIINFKIK